MSHRKLELKSTCIFVGYTGVIYLFTIIVLIVAAFMKHSKAPHIADLVWQLNNVIGLATLIDMPVG